jgi:PAS domain S-box-containing protein
MTGPPDVEAPDAKRTALVMSAIEQAALRELNSLNLHEILDADSRPTFVVDLDPDFVHDVHAIRPVFCNAALKVHDQLLDSLTLEGGDTDFNTTTYTEFRNWSTGVSRVDDSRDVFPLTLLYHGLLWTGSTVRQRWRIISGNACYQTSDIPKNGRPPKEPGKTKQDFSVIREQRPPAPPLRSVLAKTLEHETSSASPSKNTSKETSGSSSAVTLALTENVIPDITARNPRGFLSDHVAFVRSIDWANTPLGIMDNWSPQLCELVNLVMRNPFPCALFWGDELTMLYNEAYRVEVAGNKHPDLMGTGFSGPFSEVWDAVAPVFRGCAETGQATRRENEPLPIERYGYMEETFFSWSIIPLYGGSNKILGFFNTPFETTSPTVNSRRMQMLRYLGEHLNSTRTVKQFWRLVIEGLEHNEFDVPFALLYSITDSDDADTASHSSDSTISLKSCLLEGSIGIPQGHPASPHRLDLKRSQEGFVPAFREAMRTREPTTLQTRDGTLPESLLEGIEWRGYGDPCREAIIFPVRPTNGETVFAFLVIGVQPRRAYDDEYKAFAAMLNRQLATSLASVLLFEDEVRRSRNAVELATLQREQISRELELQTSRMQRMTALSPLGMYLYSPDGVLLEANDRYYEMTGHSRETREELSFLELMAEGSRDICKTMWDDMMITRQASTKELQLSSSFIQARDLSGNAIDYWVLASSQPEIGPDGEIISVMGSITDISQIKWAQGLQEMRLREADETKRQQNEFIDITSHEMRNPLSAILICSDDIRDTLSRHKFGDDDQEVVAECIEAANNIALCVQHQKSIVDDILTISKLDSNLLLITPISAQPLEVVQRAMSMFKPEVQAKDIQLEFCPHKSLEDLDIDWVLLDPGRLLQITVNLITNAIKFTATAPKRSISVHVKASSHKPKPSMKGFQFVPKRIKPLNLTAGDDWGLGELLYLRVDVEDTGCGLTPDEKALLFERFAQASPRTHAHYGGSGLGLFISRQLAELHGGQIGVASEAGTGSTFGFFIQCKKMIPRARPTISRTPTSQSFDPTSVTQDLVTAVSTLGIEPQNPPKPSQLHVLIVEDNIVNQKVLAKQLTKSGCITSTADNGIYALEHLKKTNLCTPDGIPLSIILMDWEMPEMNGLECARHIRKMQANGALKVHVPIIAVTANVRSEQIATAKESGMDDVVSKPFRIPELLAKMKDLLETLQDAGV